MLNEQVVTANFRFLQLNFYQTLNLSELASLRDKFLNILKASFREKIARKREQTRLLCKAVQVLVANSHPTNPFSGTSLLAYNNNIRICIQEKPISMSSMLLSLGSSNACVEHFTNNTHYFAIFIFLTRLSETPSRSLPP